MIGKRSKEERRGEREKNEKKRRVKVTDAFTLGLLGSGCGVGSELKSLIKLSKGSDVILLSFSGPFAEGLACKKRGKREKMNKTRGNTFLGSRCFDDVDVG